MIEDAQNRPVGTVIARHLTASCPIIEAFAVVTNVAVGASDVDVATDPLIHPFGLDLGIVSIHLHDAADEFMAQDAMESHVPLQDLEVGIAHTCTKDLDEGKVRGRLGDGDAPHLAVGIAGVGNHVGQHGSLLGGGTLRGGASSSGR